MLFILNKNRRIFIISLRIYIIYLEAVTARLEDVSLIPAEEYSNSVTIISDIIEQRPSTKERRKLQYKRWQGARLYTSP